MQGPEESNMHLDVAVTMLLHLEATPRSIQRTVLPWARARYIYSAGKHFSSLRRDLPCRFYKDSL